LPAIRRWKVRIGYQDDVVLVGAELEAPLTSRTPITRQEICLSRMLAPIGSPLPNSSSRTVSPRMQAGCRFVSSLS
jgi:hypothetical protein